jgi:uncharacterized protein YhaN
MHYKNLYIRDFGIFKNQNLNDISKNLVVIGGKNRAGKSTFLKMLRYLPFGLPQNNSIPPASSQYYIEAELEKEEKNYNLLLNGYSKPEVLTDKKEQHSSSELFNHLDQLTYQQLFSISLDELQHLSKIAKGKKKEKRLFSILMGAGFSELIRVPEIADKYFNYAKKIGGILGDPAVADFKPYYNELKEAEQSRDQALLEIKEFNNKRKELKQSQDKLKEKREEFDSLENKYFLLDLLKNNYSELEKLQRLKLELIKKAPGEADISSEKINNERILDNFLAYIKSQSKEINRYRQQEQLLKEKLSNQKLEKNKINNNFNSLISELETLNSKWQEPLKELEKIEIDLIEAQKLNDLLAEDDQLKSEIKTYKKEIQELKFEIDKNISELNSLKFKKPETVLKKSYLIIAISLITMSTTFLIDLDQLRYFSLILALSAFIYYSSNYKSSSLEAEKADKIKNEKKNNEQTIEQIKIKLKNKQKLLNQNQAALDNYAQILGIRENDYLQFINSYFRELRDKKKRYQKLKLEEAENEEKTRKIEADLKKLQNLIENAAEHSSLEFSSYQEQNLMEKQELLFEDFNILNDLLKLAENYLTVKKQLKHTLKASDRIKSALNEAGDSLQSFIDLANDFPSRAAVEEKKNILAAELNNLKEEKADLNEKITTLKNRINSLAASDRIKAAQQKIDRAQNNLEKKARSYAVNKSVSFILKKLRSRMIEKTEKELLNPAAKILKKISSQHYTELKTAADLDQSDFRVTTKSGEEFNSVQQLSRGSLEQLFLAVRISRIKEINPPLPLVLDDSLVNFDRRHLYNTAELISNLADRQQIFILSCHPHLISYIAEISDSAQYWKLEGGDFKLTNQEQLIDHLSS